MGYQEITTPLDNTTTQLSTFRMKNWVEINDQFHGAYIINNQIKFKITMLKSSLRNYSDAYILVKATTIVFGQGANNDVIIADRNNKQVNR